MAVAENPTAVSTGERRALGRIPVALFALSAGILIANIFASQTLTGLMAQSVGVSQSMSGLVAMIPFLGYAAGLFFLVPLGDLLENRGLVLKMMAVAVLSALGIIVTTNAGLFLALLFTLGAGSSCIQVLVPIAAAMAPQEQRGRVIGDVMSGLMVGILLARPAASFLAGIWGWKGFYAASAVLMALLALRLAFKLPVRKPTQTTSYLKLIGSLWHLFMFEPVLRQRAVSAAIVMAAFNFFWTTISFVLGGAPFHLSQTAIALFALVAAGGAIVTPFVGRWSDRGFGNRVTALARLAVIAAFGLAAIGGTTGILPTYLLLIILGASALLLDIGTVGDQTVGRYMINQLNPEARGRINGIFVGVFFIGGAIGSAISGALWFVGGWEVVCAGGAALGLIAFLMRR